MRDHTEVIEMITSQGIQTKENLIKSLQRGDRDQELQYDLLRRYHSLIESSDKLLEAREATEKGKPA